MHHQMPGLNTYFLTYFLTSLQLNWKLLDSVILRPANRQNLVMPVEVAELEIDDLTTPQAIYRTKRCDRGCP